MTDLALVSDPILERAKKAVPNQALTWVAVLAARQHRYGIEYIEQAPVLVIGATFGYHLRNPRAEEVIYIAQRFARIKDKKLKAAMEEFHLPYPMRKLRSTAIAPCYAQAIWDMRSIQPSALSQAIPDKVGHQIAWLRALRAARLRATQRCRTLPNGEMHWLATVFGGTIPTKVKPRDLERCAADIADMLMDRRFNPVWSFDEAVSAHAEWAANAAKRAALSNFVMTYGVGLDHEVDYTPQYNEPVALDGYDIVPLRSGESLIVEGAFMRHCVPTYMRDILSIKSCLYSIQKDGRRVATLQTSSGYAPVQIQQIKGPCNAAVTADVRKVAETFVHSIPSKRTAMDTIKQWFEQK